jgi:hypothetical protein
MTTGKTRAMRGSLHCAMDDDAALPPVEMTHILGEAKGLGEDDYWPVGGFVLDGLEGFVGLIEGEDLDLRLDVDFGG